MPPTLLDTALEYAARGWHVFPVKPGAKAPRTRNGWHDATTDAETIRAWWDRWPTANIGLALAPSGLVALDVDVAGDKLGRESLAALEADHGDLSSGLMQRSARGGLHVLFQAPPEADVHALALRPGIDLIHTGYILAAPSVLDGVPSAYAWLAQGEAKALPPGLAGEAKNRRATATVARPAGVGVDTPEGVHPKDTPAYLPVGTRNKALFAVACALHDAGLGQLAIEVAVLAEYKRRCEPEATPKIIAEIQKLVASAMRYEPSRDVAAGVVFAEALAPGSEDVVGAAEADGGELPTLASAVAEQERPPMTFYTTGFDELDTYTGGGLATRQVMGVIAPPSVGKTGFVNGIAAHVEARYGVPALICSLELTDHEVTVRLASTLSEGEDVFPWRDGLKGQISAARMKRPLKGRTLYVAGADDVNRDEPILDIAKKAVAIRDKHGKAPVIVVDYVQLMARGADDVRAAVGTLAMKLRMLAQRLDAAVLAVFTTSRGFYSEARADALRKADDPTAYLAAAKESGDVEYDCATLLYLDLDQSDGRAPVKPARCVIARCRQGEIGFVGMSFTGATGRWRSDASAAAKLSKSVGGIAKAEAAEHLHAEAVLSAVRMATEAPTKDVLRAACGIGVKAADAAIARLLMQGRLVERIDVVVDKLHRTHRRKVIAMPGGT